MWRVGRCLLILAIAANAAGDSKTVRDDPEPRTLDADRPTRRGRAEPSELAETDFQRLRAEHIARLRGWTPGKPFDFTARSRAIRKLEAQEERRNRVRTTQLGIAPLAFPTWTNLGPNPIPNGQTDPINPVSGRVSAIEIDPSDPNKVYAGAAQGGVYRSLDGGATWTPIMDSALSLAIGALALDTTQGSLYVGTGESSAAIDSFGGVGIYRIDNVNTNPVLVGPINPIRNYTDSNGPESVPIFNGSGISKILLVPNDPTKMFVSTVFYAAMGVGADYAFGQIIPPHSISGLYRLTGVNGDPASVTAAKIKVTNLGTCFDTPCTGSLDVDDLAFDPGDATGNTLFAWQHGNKFAGQMGGVYRSTNAMAATPAFTQTFLTTSGSATNGRGVFQVYKQSANPAVVYIATGEPGSGTTCNGGNGAVRVSTDGGLTFPVAKLAGGGGFCTAQCNYDIGFAVNPGATTATSDDILYLGGSFHDDSGCSLLAAKSVDGGATFAESNGGVHADNHTIRIAPSNPNILYRGDDGGIWKSTNAGVDWISLNNSTFIATQFQSIAVHPVDPNFSIGGTQDNGTENLLGNLTWNQIDFGDGGFALIDSNATNTTNVTMYHTYYNLKADTIGYARVDLVSDATDGNWFQFGCFDGSTAANGIPCTDETEFYAPMALGPGTPNIVYFATDRLYRSIDKGVNNTVVSQAPLVSGGAGISGLAISPQQDHYRIVGASDGSLFYTVTGSSTLTVLDPVGTGSVIPDQYVGRILFDPTDQHVAYIAVEGYMGDTTSAHSHLWKVSSLAASPVLTAINGSGNTGLPDVPINGIAVDPMKPSRLFVGTDIGVFDSEDGGATWSPFGLGLPRVAVFDMAIQNVKRVLRVATHGRGMYEIDLPAIATTIINPPSNVKAVATSTGSIDITWASAGTAVSYQVWRSNNNGAYAQVATPMGTSFGDSVSPDITYLYKVKSVDGATNVSPFSDMDFATTVIFDDEPLVAGVTPVKAVHLTKLRTAVNAMQRSAGVTVTSFTDPTVSIIKAIHLTELRAGLNAARAGLGARQLLFTNPAPVLIYAIDFQELRDGVK